MEGEGRGVNVVRIDISPSGNDMLKVVWNDEQPWPSYCVNRRAVEKGAELIRKILNEIVDVCLKGGLKRSGILIKELAKAGAKLHTALFTQYGGSEILAEA